MFSSFRLSVMAVITASAFSCWLCWLARKRAQRYSMYHCLVLCLILHPIIWAIQWRQTVTKILNLLYTAFEVMPQTSQISGVENPIHQYDTVTAAEWRIAESSQPLESQRDIRRVDDYSPQHMMPMHTSPPLHGMTLSPSMAGSRQETTSMDWSCIYACFIMNSEWSQYYHRIVYVCIKCLDVPGSFKRNTD